MKKIAHHQQSNITQVTSPKPQIENKRKIQQKNVIENEPKKKKRKTFFHKPAKYALKQFLSMIPEMNN